MSIKNKFFLRVLMYLGYATTVIVMVAWSSMLVSDFQSFNDTYAKQQKIKKHMLQDISTKVINDLSKVAVTSDTLFKMLESESDSGWLTRGYDGNLLMCDSSGSQYTYDKETMKLRRTGKGMYSIILRSNGEFIANNVFNAVDNDKLDKTIIKSINIANGNLTVIVGRSGLVYTVADELVLTDAQPNTLSKLLETYDVDMSLQCTPRGTYSYIGPLYVFNESKRISKELSINDLDDLLLNTSILNDTYVGYTYVLYGGNGDISMRVIYTVPLSKALSEFKDTISGLDIVTDDMRERKARMLISHILLWLLCLFLLVPFIFHTINHALRGETTN